jgi:hypothetical protein
MSTQEEHTQNAKNVQLRSVHFWSAIICIIASLIATLGVLAKQSYNYGVLNNKVDNLENDTTKQTDAIINLTKGFNCHVTGGSPNQCIVTDTLSMNK